MEILIKKDDDSGFLIHFKEDNKDSCPIFEVYEAADVNEEVAPENLYLKGMIKWDGCSHILVGPENCYLHLCGYNKWKEFSEVMDAVWDKTVKLIKDFDINEAL